MMLEYVFAAVTLAVSALLLRNLGFRGVPCFVALSLVILLSRLPEYFRGLLEAYELLSFAGEGGVAVLKIIGISYIFGISGEVCRELGEGGVATALSTVGKLEIFAVALPYLTGLISAALSLVEKQ